MACPAASINTTNDPCVQYGLQCTQNPDSPASAPTAYCGMPGELAPCLSAVGCGQITLPGAPQLSCLNEGGSNGYACFFKCATSADCIVPYESCADLGLAAGTVCYYDLCGPTATEFQAPANGTNYFEACGNATTSDGTCLPYIFDSPANDGGFLTTGLCQANGSAAAGAACSPYRTADGGPLCTSGGQCLGSTLQNGQCFQACATSDIDSLNNGTCGPNCTAAGSGCEQLYGGTDWGICFQTCTSSSTCGSLSCEG